MGGNFEILTVKVLSLTTQLGLRKAREKGLQVLDTNRGALTPPLSRRCTTKTLQMGLCFETLKQDKMAAEAYRQAWKALLEQRAARQKTRGKDGAFGDGAYGGGKSSGKEKEEAALKGSDGGGGGNNGDDEIGRIIQQAKVALTIGGGSSSNRGTSGWSRGSTPQQEHGGGAPGIRAAGESLGNLERCERLVAASRHRSPLTLKRNLMSLPFEGNIFRKG